MQGIEKFNFNKNSNIKKLIAIVSGKGGVGKSFTTSILACHLNKMDFKVGILDADITGPSIPEGFAIDELAKSNGREILPPTTKTGIKIISVNTILEDKFSPVLWRGPIINNAIRQFFSDVNWGDLDFLLVDMPPGTGDVSLTVFQSMPLDGIIVVSTPQDLVEMIVKKAVTMARLMKINILGIVENMSYFKCPTCGNIHHIFGESKIYQQAQAMGIENICKLPIDPKFSEYVDKGDIELLEITEINEFIKGLNYGI